jgi:hypothetical protein
MQKNKPISSQQTNNKESESQDPFFRRIHVQNTIIKKMLSEIDRPLINDENRPEEDDNQQQDPIQLKS